MDGWVGGLRVGSVGGRVGVWVGRFLSGVVVGGSVGGWVGRFLSGVSRWEGRCMGG